MPFSLRALFGKDQKFYDLLEASAEEALTSTSLLAAYLQRSGSFRSSGDLAGEIQVFLDAGMDGFFTDHPDIGASVTE